MRIGSAALFALLALACFCRAGYPQSDERWRQLNAEGQTADEQSRYHESEKLSLDALKEAELFGSEDSRVAATLNNLGLLYIDQGKYAEAQMRIERALTIMEKGPGSEDSILATALDNLGQVYHYEGNFAEAEVNLKRALSIREKNLGAQHSSTAIGLNNLGELYRDLGRYAEAEAHSKRALAILEKAPGSEKRLAISLNNLGLVYISQGKYVEAEV